jgi:ketose-bisphosphate aldolase
VPHVSLTTILYDATRRKYGVPNLWGGNLEKVIGYLKSAERLQAPLCICYNRGLCPDIPIEIDMPLIVRAAEHAKVPIATVLDHGEGLDEVIAAIEYGASSVMFDGSGLPYEENVAKTREIVEYAHRHKVDVEAELGAVGGSAIETGGGADIKSTQTDPKQARDFVTRTKVDALAISFGNSHGKYKGKPILNLSLVREIASRVDVPLVMHGASGLSSEDYGRVIDAGISKINYYTTMGLSSAENIRRKTAVAGEDLVCHKIVKWNIDFIQQETTDLLTLLRASGKAPGIMESMSLGSRSKAVDEQLARIVADVVAEAVKRGDVEI